jgi:DNA-binding beta-propeller fold protein YncE
MAARVLRARHRLLRVHRTSLILLLGAASALSLHVTETNAGASVPKLRADSAKTYCAEPNYSSSTVSESDQRVVAAAAFKNGTTEEQATAFAQGNYSQALGHCNVGSLSFASNGTRYLVILGTKEEAAKYAEYTASYLKASGAFSSVQVGNSTETFLDFATKIHAVRSGNSSNSTPKPSSGYRGETIAIGGDPEAMAVSPNGEFAYFVFSNSGAVRIVNLKTRKLSTIHVGQNLTDIAITPNGTQLYLTSDGSEGNYTKTAYAISTKNSSVIAVIDVGGSASTVAISPDGGFAYVTTNDALKIIGTSDQNVVGSVPITNGFAASNTVVSSDGNTVYVATGATFGATDVDSELQVIDLTTRKVVATVDQGKALNDACGLVASSSMAVLYESTCSGTTGDQSQLGLRVFNEKTNSFERGIKVTGGYRGIALQPGGKVLYAASEYSGGLSLIDTATTKVIGHMAVSTPTVEVFGRSVNPGFEDLSIASNGKRLYASTFALLNGKGSLIVIALPR